jgi:hypothetical protein
VSHFFLFEGKTGGGLFGKKPVPIEELEASHVAASSAVKDKSDLYVWRRACVLSCEYLFQISCVSFRKDMPNILEGLEQIERARLNCVHRCMRRHVIPATCCCAVLAHVASLPPPLPPSPPPSLLIAATWTSKSKL